MYLLEPTVVTLYSAVEGSDSMVLSVTKFGTSFVIFWSVAVFASSQSAPPLIGR